MLTAAGVSLSTAVKLSRSAGARLRPQLRLLVPALLEALSTLESASVRHVSVAVGHQAEQQEVVDRARLSVTKDSLMFKTLCQVGQPGWKAAGGISGRRPPPGPE